MKRVLLAIAIGGGATAFGLFLAWFIWRPEGPPPWWFVLIFWVLASLFGWSVQCGLIEDEKQ